MLGYTDNKVLQVRSQFADLLFREQFVIDKTGCKMLEVQGASFVADEDRIFGDLNLDYVRRESAWYHSQSRNVNDIPGGPPAIWKAVSSKEIITEGGEHHLPGRINSNYGWMLFSDENHNQFNSVVTELVKNPFSRRAIAIYTRPTMYQDYNKGGMSDFVCTNAVQYLIRDGFLDVVVQMRSNDIWAGYRNDRAWQVEVQSMLIDTLVESGYPEPLAMGHIYWQVGSLHAYEKDFYLVDHYLKSGVSSIKKSEYNALYPESPWTSLKSGT